jgi:hypothetical protein
MYSDGGRVYFQYGERRWDLLARGTRVEWKRAGKLNTIQVLERDTLAFELSYRSVLSSLHARWDPTFDAMDEETEDLFLWVYRRAADREWLSHAGESWSP